MNVNTGEVDESTKQDGKADCEDNLGATVKALQGITKDNFKSNSFNERIT